ncbi:MAG TPA: sigma-E factor regulatory protein RseB domain-containing protein [Stenomitos sp.]
MISRLLVLGALAVTTTASPVPAEAAPATFESLVKSSQLPYVGELVVNGSTVLKVMHGSGDRRRHEVLSPAGIRGEVIVDNGKTRWHHSPRTGQVDIAPSELNNKRPAASERLLEHNFNLKLLRKEKVAGRSTNVVDVLPRHAGRPSERLWMDEATGLPLRVERRTPEGALISTSEFRSIQVPAKVPADAFDFALPARARVTSSVQMIATGSTLADLKTATPFPVKMPTYLPPGFEVVTVHLFENNGVRSIHWRLSDGLDTLSLFQTDREHHAQRPPGAHSIAIAQGEGFVVGQGPHRMVCWQTPEGAFSLVGDLSEAELTRIAASTTSR